MEYLRMETETFGPQEYFKLWASHCGFISVKGTGDILHCLNRFKWCTCSLLWNLFHEKMKSFEWVTAWRNEWNGPQTEPFDKKVNGILHLYLCTWGIALDKTWTLLFYKDKISQDLQSQHFAFRFHWDNHVTWNEMLKITLISISLNPDQILKSQNDGLSSIGVRQSSPLFSKD